MDVKSNWLMSNKTEFVCNSKRHPLKANTPLYIRNCEESVIFKEGGEFWNCSADILPDNCKLREVERCP